MAYVQRVPEVVWLSEHLVFKEICGLRLAARSSPDCLLQQRLQDSHQDSFILGAATATASRSTGLSWLCSEAVDPHSSGHFRSGLQSCE